MKNQQCNLWSSNSNDILFALQGLSLKVIIISFDIMNQVKRWLQLKKLTLINKSKQRWRLMSLRKSFGRSRTKLSSFTPLVSCHLYWSYRLIRSLRSSGSNRWDIHCSASLLFTLISSNLVCVDCKYVCFKTNQVESVKI
jgi:hypothetical protein